MGIKSTFDQRNKNEVLRNSFFLQNTLHHRQIPPGTGKISLKMTSPRTLKVFHPGKDIVIDDDRHIRMKTLRHALTFILTAFDIFCSPCSGTGATFKKNDKNQIFCDDKQMAFHASPQKSSSSIAA